MHELGIVRRMALNPAPIELPAILLAQWASALAAVRAWRPLAETLADNVRRHGDAPRWLAALHALPELPVAMPCCGDTIRVGAPEACPTDAHARLCDALMALRPWRKGPFELFGIRVDAEWRSDRKWRRLEPHLDTLSGQRVLDVGSGNGYYGWRMRAAGAAQVIGVDPGVLCLMQHLAMCRYVPEREAVGNCILPARLEDVPASASFDTVFSMGVLYHRRDPATHLAQLRAQLRAGGRLVLETLIVADTTRHVLVPGDRYARMRNVWALPTPEILLDWIESAGFTDARLVDQTRTTTDEQRRTAWMPFESLADALDPDDPSRTREGHPAPVRAIVIARR